jgi:hypothetical protein
MAFLDLTASNAASTGVSSPFENNAYLIVGGEAPVYGGAFQGGSSNATPIATASTGSPGAGTSPAAAYGAVPGAAGNLTGALGTLLNNSTFWIALGALVTVLLIIKKKG